MKFDGKEDKLEYFSMGKKITVELCPTMSISDDNQQGQLFCRVIFNEDWEKLQYYNGNCRIDRIDENLKDILKLEYLILKNHIRSTVDHENVLHWSVEEAENTVSRLLKDERYIFGFIIAYYKYFSKKFIYWKILLEMHRLRIFEDFNKKPQHILAASLVDGFKESDH